MVLGKDCGWGCGVVPRENTALLMYHKRHHIKQLGGSGNHRLTVSKGQQHVERSPRKGILEWLLELPACKRVQDTDYFIDPHGDPAGRLLI